MKKTLIAVGCVSLLLALAGCKKKEEEVPPPPPPVAPAPTPAPTPVAIVTEEEASAPVEDAAPDVKKPAAHAAAPADVAGLRACCTALQQNAASMPPPNNTYALQAAQVCQALVSALAAGSTTKVGALGSISSVLKGANLPPACR